MTDITIADYRVCPLGGEPPAEAEQLYAALFAGDPGRGHPLGSYDTVASIMVDDRVYQVVWARDAWYGELLTPSRADICTYGLALRQVGVVESPNPRGFADDGEVAEAAMRFLAQRAPEGAVIMAAVRGLCERYGCPMCELPGARLLTPA